jgi:tRNA 2-thiocytidine biosynthesis protein TtcA
MKIGESYLYFHYNYTVTYHLRQSMNVSIAQPPWSGLGKRLESTMRKALYDFKMLEGISKVAVALSGGKDSLALLFLLKAISGRGFPELDLHAVHVSGEFSCGAGVNLDYLRAICDQLQVNFLVRESTQKLETLECYSCSRERRRLLFEAAKSVGVETIAFGHHRDDNAQTILMNLLHKAEFTGNLPKLRMHEYGVTIIRPLIYVSEADIRTFAQQYGFMRIMCRCPVGQHSLRKKVDSLLTEIEDLFPNARANIAQAGLQYGSHKAENP